jgi:hypothetical protein
MLTKLFRRCCHELVHMHTSYMSLSSNVSRNVAVVDWQLQLVSASTQLHIGAGECVMARPELPSMHLCVMRNSHTAVHCHILL